MEILTTVISIIALIISIINLFFYLIRYRKNIELIINTSRVARLENGYFYIYHIQIINNSKIPISIKGMSCNGCNVPSKPYLVSENTKRRGKEIIYHEEIKTIEFPVNLDGLQGYSGYIEFKNKENLSLEDIRYTIYTNRGTIKEAKINYENVKDDIEYKPFD